MNADGVQVHRRRDGSAARPGGCRAHAEASVVAAMRREADETPVDVQMHQG